MSKPLICARTGGVLKTRMRGYSTEENMRRLMNYMLDDEPSVSVLEAAVEVLTGKPYEMLLNMRNAPDVQRNLHRDFAPRIIKHLRGLIKKLENYDE